MKVLYWSLVIVIIDQITKLAVKGINIPWLGIHHNGMAYQSSIKVIGDVFQFTFIENPGMAFGLQLGSKLFLTLFTIFATILIFFIIYKNRNESYLLRIALAFILGGAMGNLIDRTFYGVMYDYAPFFYGRVVDFFHFDIPDFRIFGRTVYTFPIFNVADIAVTAGFILILFGYKKAFKEDQKEVSTNNELAAANMQFAATGGITMGSTELTPNEQSEKELADIEREKQKEIENEGSKEVHIPKPENLNEEDIAKERLEDNERIVIPNQDMPGLK